MNLSEFVDNNKASIHKLGNRAASPFRLLYQGVYVNFIEYKNKMIEAGTIEANGMSAFQAVYILFDGIKTNKGKK